MSVIKVAHHNERINMILYQKPPPRPKSPMPVSERVKTLRCQKKCVEMAYKTMGEADATLRPPDKYLKKGEGQKILTNAKGKRCPCIDMINVVIEPKKVKPRKVKEPNDSCPWKRREKKIVDKQTGDRVNVIKNTWVYQTGHGSLPKYLVKRNNKKKRAEEAYRKVLENQEPLCKAVPDQERDEVLEGLKSNYKGLHREFLLLPMMIDTIPVINRKRCLEVDIKQAEKDLELIEKNPYIYIYE